MPTSSQGINEAWSPRKQQQQAAAEEEEGEELSESGPSQPGSGNYANETRGGKSGGDRYLSKTRRLLRGLVGNLS